MKYKIELISNSKSIIFYIYLYRFRLNLTQFHIWSNKSHNMSNCHNNSYKMPLLDWKIKSGGKSGIKSSYFYKIQVCQWLNSWSRYDYYSISWQLRIFMDLLFWPILWIFSGYSKNFCLTGLKTIECMNVIWKLFPADIEIITT